MSLAVEPCKPSSRRRVRQVRVRSLIDTLAAAILGLLALLCVSLLAPVLLRSVAMDDTELKPRACDTIQSTAERLICLDRQKQPPRVFIRPL